MGNATSEYGSEYGSQSTEYEDLDALQEEGDDDVKKHHGHSHENLEHSHSHGGDECHGHSHDDHSSLIGQEENTPLKSHDFNYEHPHEEAQTTTSIKDVHDSIAESGVEEKSTDFASMEENVILGHNSLGAPSSERDMMLLTPPSKRPPTPHSSLAQKNGGFMISQDGLDLGPSQGSNLYEGDRDDASTSIDGSVVAQKGQDTPRSLWSQLLGGNDSSDESDAEENAPDEDGRSISQPASGIQLLGEHLARVKLEFEEQAYQYRRQIKKLEDDKLEQQQALREAYERALKLEEQVKTLELQNTRKWQIESRDNWLKQIESLKQERNRLRQENERMTESLAALGVGDKSRFNANDVKTQLSKVLEDLTEEHSENSRLRAELEQANERVEKAEAAAKALKKKLDFELELKWERHKLDMQNEEEGSSILGLIGDVVAPRLA